MYQVNHLSSPMAKKSPIPVRTAISCNHTIDLSFILIKYLFMILTFVANAF